LLDQKNDWCWAVSMRHMDILNYIPVSYHPNLSVFDIARTKGAILSQRTLCTPLLGVQVLLEHKQIYSSGVLSCWQRNYHPQ